MITHQELRNLGFRPAKEHIRVKRPMFYELKPYARLSSCGYAYDEKEGSFWRLFIKKAFTEPYINFYELKDLRLYLYLQQRKVKI